MIGQLRPFDPTLFQRFHFVSTGATLSSPLSELILSEAQENDVIRKLLCTKPLNKRIYFTAWDQRDIRGQIRGQDDVFTCFMSGIVRVKTARGDLCKKCRTEYQIVRRLPQSEIRTYLRTGKEYRLQSGVIFKMYLFVQHQLNTRNTLRHFENVLLSKKLPMQQCQKEN